MHDLASLCDAISRRMSMTAENKMHLSSIASPIDLWIDHQICHEAISSSLPLEKLELLACQIAYLFAKKEPSHLADLLEKEHKRALTVIDQFTLDPEPFSLLKKICQPHPHIEPLLAKALLDNEDVALAFFANGPEGRIEAIISMDFIETHEPEHFKMPQLTGDYYKKSALFHFEKRLGLSFPLLDHIRKIEGLSVFIAPSFERDFLATLALNNAAAPRFIPLICHQKEILSREESLIAFSKNRIWVPAEKKGKTAALITLPKDQIDHARQISRLFLSSKESGILPDFASSLFFIGKELEKTDPHSLYAAILATPLIHEIKRCSLLEKVIIDELTRRGFGFGFNSHSRKIEPLLTEHAFEPAIAIKDLLEGAFRCAMKILGLQTSFGT